MSAVLNCKGRRFETDWAGPGKCIRVHIRMGLEMTI